MPVSMLAGISVSAKTYTRPHTLAPLSYRFYLGIFRHFEFTFQIYVSTQNNWKTEVYALQLTRQPFVIRCLPSLFSFSLSPWERIFYEYINIYYNVAFNGYTCNLYNFPLWAHPSFKQRKCFQSDAQIIRAGVQTPTFPRINLTNGPNVIRGKSLGRIDLLTGVEAFFRHRHWRMCVCEQTPN